MTIEAVGFHIDKCDGIPISKKIVAKAPAPKPERLPHPHYSGLKDTALRKKLADQGIISTGSRQLMERRYTEWVTLWNANCDSKTPRGKSDLRRELDTWERTQGGKANMNGRDQVIGAQIRDKDFDGKAWAAKNDEAFKDLIAKARRKPAPKVVAPEPSSTGGDESVESQMESQIQDASRQDLPGGAVTSYTRYQSTSALDEDIVSSDIADIAHINTLQ
jgi:E3 ubiquitin-protein ligase RAD18